MAMRFVGEESLCGWKVVVLESERLRIAVAPAIGGRLLSLRFDGEEFLYIQDEHAGEVFDLARVTDLRAEKRAMGHRLWGGDKTWIAPQSAWWERIPPLELDAGVYDCRQEDDCSLVLTSPVCRETGLQIERRLTLHDTSLALTETIINRSSNEIERGVWNVTQCLRPMQIHVRASDLRAYPEEGESVILKPEVVRPSEPGWVSVTCEAWRQFKFGALASEGILVASRPSVRFPSDQLVFARTFSISATERYAHDSSVEIYNSHEYNYLEIEVHAPLARLQPGASSSLSQIWHFNRISTGTSLGAIVSRIREH